MGKTKTNSEIVTDIMTSAVTRATQNCTTSSVTGQKVVISNVKNSTVSGVVVRQNISVKINCSINMDLANKIQEDIATKITSSNKETSQAVLSGLNSLFGGGTKVTNTTKLLTTLKKDFSTESIQDMVNAVNSNQELTIDKIDGSTVSNITLDQQSTFVADTISQIIAKNDLVSAMRANEERQNVVEEKNPVSDVIAATGDAASKTIDSGGNAASKTIDSAGNAAGNAAKGVIMGLVIPIVLLFVLVIAMALIYRFFFKNRDSSPPPPSNFTPGYTPYEPQQYEQDQQYGQQQYRQQQYAQQYDQQYGQQPGLGVVQPG
jgi:hypothetical protein